MNEVQMSASDVLSAIDAGARLDRAHAQGVVELRLPNGDIVYVRTAIFDQLQDGHIEPEVGTSGFYRRKN
jgi:hypothetical protein